MPACCARGLPPVAPSSTTGRTLHPNGTRLTQSCKNRRSRRFPTSARSRRLRHRHVHPEQPQRPPPCDFTASTTQRVTRQPVDDAPQSDRVRRQGPAHIHVPTPTHASKSSPRSIATHVTGGRPTDGDPELKRWQQGRPRTHEPCPPHRPTTACSAPNRPRGVRALYFTNAPWRNSVLAPLRRLA